MENWGITAAHNLYYSHSVSKLSPNIIPVLFDEIMQQIHSKPTKFINFCPIELQIDVLFFILTTNRLIDG